ncbi:hypothetical protein [Bradyrhizobium sp.]|uniref:hypothetical protein n=1 Tax=Bradyrhizobium sp. TaxID=376 RepID=UPI003C498A85
MKQLILSLAAVAWLVFAGCAASAQVPNNPPGGSRFNPPLPPPPPGPKIEVPKVPQMDAPLHDDYAPPPHSSFRARISRCLDQAAAAGVRPGARAAYSRNCANR